MRSAQEGDAAYALGDILETVEPACCIDECLSVVLVIYYGEEVAFLYISADQAS
jgi:hypothetical protein